MANAIIEHLEAKDDLYVPQFEEISKGVFERYHADFRAERGHWYEYKLKSGRVQ